MNYKCKDTNTLCKLCSNESICLLCKKNAVLSNNSAVRICNCKNGFRYNKLKNRCQRIIKKERNCKITDFFSCRKCKNEKCKECKTNSSFDIKTNSCICDYTYIKNEFKGKCERIHCEKGKHFDVKRNKCSENYIN